MPITLAFGALEGQNVTVAVQDFAFQGGTLGMAAGEAIVRGMTLAVERQSPFIIFTASGGARMQEGMFALMQMPRTTVAVRRLRAAKLPYIVVLTNPTTGGVTASYAMLGDVHIAEPGADHRLRRSAGDRADDPRAAARRLPAGGVSAHPRHGRHGRAAPAAARNARPTVPPVVPGAGGRLSGHATMPNGPDFPCYALIIAKEQGRGELGVRASATKSRSFRASWLKFILAGS